MNEMFSIEGKVAVITGAGGVLGGSIAKSFVKAGARVVAMDIRQEPWTYVRKILMHVWLN